MVPTPLQTEPEHAVEDLHGAPHRRPELVVETVRTRPVTVLRPHPSEGRVRRRNSSRPRLGPMRAVDAFLRRDDTWLARGLRALSPATGETYGRSPAKRALDIAVGLPASILAVPVIVVLVLLNKLLHPHAPAFFLQNRVGHAGRALRVVKVRSMRSPARRNVAGEQRSASPAEGRTSVGRLMSRHYLDELPQLPGVLSGRLSIVGIRVLPREVYEELGRSWSPARYDAWRTAYAVTPLGLTGIHQVFRGPGKHDAGRFHRDVFYARKASLGLDLYLLWRTLGTTDR